MKYLCSLVWFMFLSDVPLSTTQDINYGSMGGPDHNAAQVTLPPSSLIPYLSWMRLPYILIIVRVSGWSDLQPTRSRKQPPPLWLEEARGRAQHAVH